MKPHPNNHNESAINPLNTRNSSITNADSQNIHQKDAQTDQALVQQSLHLMHASIHAVKKILPDTDTELIGGFFADLYDLWETGQKLDKELRKLAEDRFPHDRERLSELLNWISAIQIDMASYWIGEINKDLPKLRHALDTLEGESSKDKHKMHTRKREVSKHVRVPRKK